MALIRRSTVFIVGVSFLVLRPPLYAAAPLQFIQAIALENVEGRIDHLSVDVAGQRLFVAARDNHTVEVIDLKEGHRLRQLRNLEEPQGVLFVPGANRLFVANSANGALIIFDGRTLKSLGQIDLEEDADNLQYDEAKRLVYAGYGIGALGVIDPVTGKLLNSIVLPGHPESFQIEDSSSRIFVNIPQGLIAIIDRTQGKIIHTWKAGVLLSANFPMALDATSHRLFVGYRAPTRLVVFNTETGQVAANLASVGDADDIFIDAARHRVYISGGEGIIAVLTQRDADHYQTMARIPTAPGARTSLFVPALSRLYLAVPRRGVQPAEIRVYQAL